MSEEKLYMVKNDEGKYWDFGNSGFWRRDFPDCLTTSSRNQAGLVAFENGGHVVELTEEPEKGVVSEEEAEMLSMAKTSGHPYGYIYAHTHTAVNEDRLMRAYVNGYTVEEKKYNLVLGTDTDDGTNSLFKYESCTDDALGLNTDTYADDLKLDKLYQFTQSEIDKYNNDFWIKNIDLNDYKIEVTDDEQ